MKPLIVLILLHNTYQTLDYWPGGGYTPVIQLLRRQRQENCGVRPVWENLSRLYLQNANRRVGVWLKWTWFNPQNCNLKIYIYIWHCIQYLLVYSHLLPT
jgi:hypothetical protein